MLINFISLFFQSVSEEEKAEKGKIIKVLAMNKAEWFWILLGCISSVFIGAALPVYSVLFGDIIGVSLLQDVKDLVTSC